MKTTIAFPSFDADFESGKGPRTSRDGIFLIENLGPWLAIILILAIFCVLLAPRVSNCGGMNYATARDEVHYYSNILFKIPLGNSDKDQFSLEDATPGQLELLLDFADGVNTSFKKNFLVAPLPYRIGPQAPRKLTIVCDEPFPSGPRRLFFSSPLVHAAAYTDGSTGFISEEEFQGLDLSSYIRLEQLVDQLKERQKQKPPPQSEKDGLNASLDQ